MSHRLDLPAFLFLAAASCSSGSPSSAATEPAAQHQISCAGKTDTAKVPISDLRTGCYLSFQGGLYPDGSDSLPAAHLAAGIAAASQIRPLGTNGAPSATGKIILLSIGMSNTTQEFCSDGGLPASCQSPSFVTQATADASVNHSTLVLVNGAAGGRTSDYWTNPTSTEYDRIRDTWLTPLGLSERQVQIAWVKTANAQPKRALPDTAADAYQLVRQLGQILRALKTRYPNLHQVFLTSRIYAGYATSTLNPEPYAYETAFGVKWAIQAQIDEMSGRGPDGRAGSLRYDTGIAPWVAWGPYPWAAGATPRSDGLAWVPSDFNTSDFTHPGTTARQKVGGMLLGFLKSSSVTQCWFLTGRTC